LGVLLGVEEFGRLDVLVAVALSLVRKASAGEFANVVS
jgi:hypothetical protein